LLLFLAVSAISQHRLDFGEGLTYSNTMQIDEIATDTVPEPRYVMRRSMVIPGWGQIINQQSWKVPIVYGIIVGVASYSYYANERYQGYRAAYYNSFDEHTDQRFGPTPAFVPTDQPQGVYRQNRDLYRNRRDLSFVGIFLAYGLNVADAYIFAQLRDFDVSDDLSANFGIVPETIHGTHQPMVSVRLNF
jgi:hypothetical protein